MAKQRSAAIKTKAVNGGKSSEIRGAAKAEPAVELVPAAFGGKQEVHEGHGGHHQFAQPGHTGMYGGVYGHQGGGYGYHGGGWSWLVPFAAGMTVPYLLGGAGYGGYPYPVYPTYPTYPAPYPATYSTTYSITSPATYPTYPTTYPAAYPTTYPTYPTSYPAAYPAL